MLIIQVDKLSGNFEQQFKYSLDLAFNDIIGNISEAEIRIEIPDYLDIKLGNYQQPVIAVIENEIASGREIVFKFAAIEDLGLALRLDFSLNFNLKATTNANFIAKPQLWINGQLLQIAEAAPISLKLNGQFELSRQLILPASSPAPGSEVYFKITLENVGDLGAKLEALQISCPQINGLIIDQNYPIIGYDRSAKFADKSADGLNAIIQNDSVILEIGSYSGQKYEFIYKAKIASSLVVGSQFALSTTYSLNGLVSQTIMDTVILSAPKYQATLGLYGPDYSLPEQYICYQFNIENDGNQILENTSLSIELPAQADFYQFSSGTFWIKALQENINLSYQIECETKNGKIINIGTFNTDTNSNFDLSDYLSITDSPRYLHWRFPQFIIGLRQRNSPRFLGIVRPEIAMEAILLAGFDCSYSQNEQTETINSSFATIIANTCVLLPELKWTANNDLKPGDIIEVSLNISCRRSRLNNPIIACFLPSKLGNISNVTYTYSDIFEQIMPFNPEPIISEEFSPGYNLIKFEYSGNNSFEFRQLAKIKISFMAQVKVGAYGMIDAFSLLNCQNALAVAANNTIYKDSLGISNLQGIGLNYVQSNILKSNIQFFAAVSANQKVKGSLDAVFTEYPQLASTYPGGKLQYLISLENIGNANLDLIEIVDILPHVNDQGVIQVNQKRNSQFSVYLLNEISAKILPTDDESGIEIAYSESVNPLRFGAAFNMIGNDDNWQSGIPEDLIKLRSFKLISQNLILKPGERLEIYLNCLAPVGIEPEQVAWNSFAANISYVDMEGQSRQLLAVEPEKVGIKIQKIPDTKVAIGGQVWFDGNGDGLMDEGEDLLNDIGIALLDGDLAIIDAIFSAPDASGLAGQFLFSNLEPGQYYLRFFIDDRVHKFSDFRDSILGNKVKSSRGLTGVLDLRAGDILNDINAGLVAIDAITIANLLKVNRNARQMVRDVIKNQMLLLMKEEDVMDLIILEQEKR